MEDTKRLCLKNIVPAVVLTYVLCSAPLWAQDTPGAQVDFNLSTGLFHEDNDDTGSQTYLSTGLGAEAVASTRSQVFRFSLDTDLRITEDAIEAFEDVTAAAFYSYDTRNFRLNTNLSYDVSELGDADLGDDFDADDLTGTTGRLEVHAADATVEFGRAARFGSEIQLGYRSESYRNTTDPDLFDDVTLSAGTTLRFTLSRRAELRAFVNWAETETQDLVSTLETDTDIGLAGDLLIDRAWTLGFSLAYTRDDTETDDGIGGRVSVLEEGVSASTTLTRDLANGDLRFRIGIDQTGDDTVSSFLATRQLDLANGANLTAGLGAIGFDSGNVLPTLQLDYRQEVLRGQVLALSFSQEGDEDDANEQILRTQFSLDYDIDLTPNSRLGLTGALAAVDVQGGAGDDTMRPNFGITYSHDLNRDWALVAQADTELVFENGTRTDRENRISLTLERSFSFRP